MQIRSIYRGAKISAFKCREVTREIQGKSVADALDILTFTPRKAARLVEKTLKSAIANAENNNNLRADKLVVQEAVVGEAATLKRFQPKARGSAGPIRKRSSHIRIILTDEITLVKRAARKPAAGKKNARKRADAKASPAKKKVPSQKAESAASHAESSIDPSTPTEASTSSEAAESNPTQE